MHVQQCLATMTLCSTTFRPFISRHRKWWHQNDINIYWINWINTHKLRYNAQLHQKHQEPQWQSIVRISST